MRPQRSGVEQPRHFLTGSRWWPPKRLTTRSPMASGDSIKQLRFICNVRSHWTGHMLAVGSMVPKVTLVRQFRLNSSLYVSRPTGRARALCSFFLCGMISGREGNASRRQARQLYFCFSLHEMSPVHWTDG
ncbi:hypothetical protein RDI58_014880 [Solanum bulbocastanum]|uniref:Uncharacterized protein n=1 Tax=Solanum bulbocastanum TaxID=147425 RepID=A0AAN8YAZ8_SOLBU